MMAEGSEPLAYTIPAAVRASGVARTRLYELIAERKIQAVKSGRRTLVLADSLRRYLGSLPPARIGSRERQWPPETPAPAPKPGARTKLAARRRSKSRRAS